MGGPSGTWTTTSGGSGGSAVAVIAAVVGGAFACALLAAVARAVAAIPAWVYVLGAVVAVGAVTWVTRFLVRSNRAQAAALTTRRAEMEAAEDRQIAASHQRRLERARAAAPVIENHIHNHMDPDAIAAALLRQGAPRAQCTTTVITDRQEIPR